jgi:hypothetical protein
MCEEQQFFQTTIGCSGTGMRTNITFAQFTSLLATRKPRLKYLSLSGHGDQLYPPTNEYTFGFSAGDGSGLASEPVDPSAVASVISNQGIDSAGDGELEVVCLNGCNTSTLAHKITGVRFVVYWRTVVTDRAATSFLKEMYNCLWRQPQVDNGIDVEAAFVDAVEVLRTKGFRFGEPDRALVTNSAHGIPALRDTISNTVIDALQVK